MIKAVFGMGIALKNHWKLIEKNYKPKFVVDNDSRKWGTIDFDTKLYCISPKELEQYEQREVLITIGDPYIVEQVKEQLKSLNTEYKVLTEELERWTIEEPLPKHLQEMEKSEKKIILFNTPEHDNLGDHLITLSELDFLRKRFWDYKIYEVTDIEYLWHHLKIKEYVSPQDIVLVTGGGFLGSLWLYNGELNVRNILKEYQDNKVIILPQTIYFEKNVRGEEQLAQTIKSYNEHRQLTICAREKKSFLLLKSILEAHIKIELLPDMALTYQTKHKTKNKGGGYTAYVCFRKDKESVLSEKQREEICNTLKKLGWNIKEISMHSNGVTGIEERQQEVAQKLEEIRQSDLIVTDRLHGMISAAITDTPCVAWDNLSGKVKAVYEWLKEESSVRFCESSFEFEQQVLHACRKDRKEKKLNFFEYECLLEELIRRE